MSTSTALVPEALARDLEAEFNAQAGRTAEQLSTLRAQTAAAIGAAKMRTLALPSPAFDDAPKTTRKSAIANTIHE